jgi:arylsulfatase A-like enzyme
VEAGVTFVEVRAPGNWDAHNDMATRHGQLIPPVDAGFGALLEDLKTRGMLDRTLVVWMGEFGRTPKPNATGGRDHFPRAFSAAVAGCGVQGGQVIGGTTPDGTDIASDPVTVPDLLASFCQALKVDPAKENLSPIGRPLKIVDGGQAVPGLLV